MTVSKKIRSRDLVDGMIVSKNCHHGDDCVWWCHRRSLVGVKSQFGWWQLSTTSKDTVSLIPTRHSIRQTFSELQRLTSREHDETDRQKEWRDWLISLLSCAKLQLRAFFLAGRRQTTRRRRHHRRKKNKRTWKRYYQRVVWYDRSDLSTNDCMRQLSIKIIYLIFTKKSKA